MWASALKSFSSNISSNYKIADHFTVISGPWRVYDAKHKTSGKAVSVFVFDKRSLESQGGSLGGRSSNQSLKRAHEEVLERLKREASSLARLRHPSILEIAEPVEESRNGGLMFATEPVSATLASLLAEKDDEERANGVGGRGSRHVVKDGEGGRKRRDVELDQLEMQKGLLQIGKGLEFLHESAGLVHGNLVPETIFVNAKSAWKISGLGFSGKNEESTSASASTQPAIALSEVLNHDPRLPSTVQLNLDFTSPDFVIDNSVTSAADIFALGLLIVALYNSPHRSPLETNQSISTYKRIFSSASNSPSHTNNYLSSTALPRDVMVLLPRLLARRPAQRMSAKEFQNAQFFDNILVSTLRFMESLPAKTPNEKLMFLKGLPRILGQFPKSVLEKKVLPALLEEMKDKELIAQVLQNVFIMLKYMPSGKRAFAEKIIPRLREIFLAAPTGKTAAVAPVPEKDTAKAAGLMILLENIQTIADNTNGKQFEEDIWPIIRISMESPAHALIDTALRTLSVMLAVLDFPTIKNDVFPVIASVFSKTNSLGIKIRGLEALQTLCGGSPGQDDFASDGLDGLPVDSTKSKKNSAILDKYTIQEKIVPLLKAIKTKEPAVMLAALEVFKEVGKIADADFLATEAMPVLWGFALGPLLNLPQYQAFMSLIQSYTQRIAQEQTRKLQEMSATQPPVAQRGDFMTFARVSQVNGPENGASVSEGDFESLVLGRIEPKDTNGLDSGDTLGGWGSASASAPVGRATSSIPAFNPAPASATATAPTFSWSTPASQPSLQPLQPTTTAAFRTVTPDQSLNSFSTMKPMALSTNLPSTLSQQPLQPSNPWQTSQTPLSPTYSSAQSSQPISQGVDWSSASNSSSSIWATPMAQPSTFQSTLPHQAPKTNAFPAPPPSSSLYSNFSIAPPPAGSMARQASYQSTPNGSNGGFGHSMQPQVGTMNARLAQTPQQPSAKTGLDKYESLI